MAHGFYKNEPRLDIDLLHRIAGRYPQDNGAGQGQA